MSQNKADTSLVTEIQNDSLGEFKPPRKKQKRGNESSNRNLRQTSQSDGLVDVLDGPVEHGARAIEQESESDQTSGSEPDVQLMAPVQRLSTFDPSKSKILSETETEWTVRLHPNDVSVSIARLYCQI